MLAADREFFDESVARDLAVLSRLSVRACVRGEHNNTLSVHSFWKIVQCNVT